MDRTAADYMGMMATIMNGVALQDALESVGLDVRLTSSLQLPEVAEYYIKRKAKEHLKK
jgi:uridylate kinase